MRKVIVSNIMSLDGCVAGPGDDVMAMPMDPSFDAYNVERMRAADTMLLGARSYEGFRGHWPAIADDEGSSRDNRDISRRWGEMDIVVVSDHLTPEPTQPWHDRTTIVPRAQAHEHVAALRAQDGREILTFGSRTLWNDLLAAGLVDELHLMVGAAIVGAGTPAFDGEPAVSLRLADVKRFHGSSNVVLRYAVSRGRGRAGR
jgi:dihydrofolate reductase